MTRKLTILFDLDGTLVDTAPDLMGAHNHVMKKFGFHRKNLGDIKHLAGRGAWIMMQRSFKEEIKDEKVKKEMVKEFIDHYEKNIDKGSKPIKGVVPFLKWASSEKIPMAVCTNKHERLAVDLLKKIKLPITSDLVIQNYWAGIAYENNKIKWEKNFDSSNEAMVGSRIINFDIKTKEFEQNLKG